MKKTSFLIGLLILTVLVSGCISLQDYKKEKIEINCTEDNECDWVSINCCSESNGAQWKCINIKKSQNFCPKEIGCYTFVSPKPESKCACINNKCEIKKEV